MPVSGSIRLLHIGLLSFGVPATYPAPVESHPRHGKGLNGTSSTERAL
jgi:hypothetical protein